MFNAAMIKESVFRSEQSVGNTLKKLANDATFAETRPNTHKVLASLAQSYGVYGKLTNNQKQLAAKLITQQIGYLVEKANARVTAHIVVAPTDEQIEREAIQNEEAPF